jgi:hypothetical protein
MDRCNTAPPGTEDVMSEGSQEEEVASVWAICRTRKVVCAFERRDVVEG